MLIYDITKKTSF